jgi:hypothetical protein
MIESCRQSLRQADNSASRTYHEALTIWNAGLMDLCDRSVDLLSVDTPPLAIVPQVAPLKIKRLQAPHENSLTVEIPVRRNDKRLILCPRRECGQSGNPVEVTFRPRSGLSRAACGIEGLVMLS